MCYNIYLKTNFVGLQLHMHHTIVSFINSEVLKLVPTKYRLDKEDINLSRNLYEQCVSRLDFPSPRQGDIKDNLNWCKALAILGTTSFNIKTNVVKFLSNCEDKDIDIEEFESKFKSLGYFNPEALVTIQDFIDTIHNFKIQKDTIC